MSDEWFAEGLQLSDGNPQDFGVGNFDDALFKDLDELLNEQQNAKEGDDTNSNDPGSSSMVPRKGANVASSIEERNSMLRTPAKKYEQIELPPLEPRRLYDTSNADFHLGVQMANEDYPLQDNPILMMRGESKNLSDTEETLHSAFNRFVSDGGGTDENYESVGIENLDAATILSDMLTDGKDIKGKTISDGSMTNVQMRPTHIGEEIDRVSEKHVPGAEQQLQPEPEPEPEPEVVVHAGAAVEEEGIEDDGVDEDEDAPPALDDKLSNIMRVFQAVYYHHRSLGGALETTFRMRDVEAMYPEIVELLRNGHGLIPGKLTKPPHGVITHVQKGRGTYRMTGAGVEKAMEKRW